MSEKLREQIEEQRQIRRYRHFILYKMLGCVDERIGSSVFSRKDLGIRRLEITDHAEGRDGLDPESIQRAINRASEKKGPTDFLRKLDSIIYYHRMRLSKRIGWSVGEVDVGRLKAWYIDPFQKSLELLNPGGLVWVKDGTYTRDTYLDIMDKPNIDLAGAGQSSIIKMTANAPLMKIKTTSGKTNVVVENLKLQGPGWEAPTWDAADGIWSQDVDYFIVRNTVVRGCRDGIKQVGGWQAYYRDMEIGKHYNPASTDYCNCGFVGTAGDANDKSVNATFINVWVSKPKAKGFWIKPVNAVMALFCQVLEPQEQGFLAEGYAGNEGHGSNGLIFVQIDQGVGDCYEFTRTTRGSLPTWELLECYASSMPYKQAEPHNHGERALYAENIERLYINGGDFWSCKENLVFKNCHRVKLIGVGTDKFSDYGASPPPSPWDGYGGIIFEDCMKSVMTGCEIDSNYNLATGTIGVEQKGTEGQLEVGPNFINEDRFPIPWKPKQAGWIRLTLGNAVMICGYDSNGNRRELMTLGDDNILRIKSEVDQIQLHPKQITTGTEGGSVHGVLEVYVDGVKKYVNVRNVPA